MYLRIGYFGEFKGNDTILVGGDEEGLRQLADALRTLEAVSAEPVYLHLLPSVGIHAGVQLRACPVDREPGVRRSGPGACFTWHESEEGWLESAEKIEAVARCSGGHCILGGTAAGDAVVMISKGEYDDAWWEKHGKLPAQPQNPIGVPVAEPIISVSGLRGVVGETLTPDTAIRYVAAFAAGAPPGAIVVGRDSRPSGTMLAAAILAGIEALGRSALDAGIVPTPTAGVLVRQSGAAGGVQITASHNPSPYNGIKLFSAVGRVIPADVGEQVLARYRRGEFPWTPHDRLGASRSLPDPLAGHLDAVLAIVDVPRIRCQRFKVVLDSNHGAGGALGRRLLDALGCQTTILGETPDGQFEHPPEPTAENLAGVLAAVPLAGADVGFCQDPDADRLAVIDGAGRYIGEEYTVALCVQHVLPRRPGPIVVNCSSSRMSQDVAQRHGVPLVRGGRRGERRRRHAPL